MGDFATMLTGTHPTFQALVRSAQIVAATDVSVLLLGETGTGKERMAEAIHRESRRRDQRFIAVNCAALPEALAESLLFGHRKGAFTSATQDNEGYLLAAHGGTLFLDEVGELPLELQAKLLRFFESGEILPVGATRTQQVDVRIVAATNRDLADQVDQGQFRADLYYRLHVVPLELPALRERGQDLQLLLQHFTRELAKRHRLAAPQYHKETLKQLQRYNWPGNIRELRNFAERMLVLFSGRPVMPENLPREIRARPDATTHSRQLTLPEGGINLQGLEVDFIQQALQRAQGNRSQAARLLGLSRDTLLYRIKKYALAR